MTKLISSIALGAAIVSMPALAQAPGARGGWGQRDQTREEARQRADMMFQMIDSNRDGIVTRQEAEQALGAFEASHGAGEGGGHRAAMMQRMLDRLFASSPSVSLQQFEALMLARFDAQDLNHDGVVTADERRQLREQNGRGQMTVAPPSPPAGALPPPPKLQ